MGNSDLTRLLYGRARSFVRRATIHAPLSSKQQLSSVAHPYVLILFGALALTLPAAFQDQKFSDSFWNDWVWIDQFNRGLASGELYPRWLPQSHGGLGPPVFYYYPPLAFYVSGLFGLTGMSTYGTLIAAAGVGFALSGVTMYHWLKGWTAHPTMGALIFMAAPYHVIDFYRRGAIAEFIAILFIPLVALGIRRIAEDGRIGLAAVSYAALVCTHLPLAVITTVFLIGPYVLISAGKTPRLLMRAAAAGLLGLALSSIYLLPALALDEYRHSQKLWEDVLFQPETWTFIWQESALPRSGMLQITKWILIAALPPCLLLLIRERSGWAASALVVMALIAGIVPRLWDLPVLRNVQFPFRALPVVEFFLATALARCAWRSWMSGLLVPSFVLTYTAIALPLQAPEEVTPEIVRAHYPDVPENLPPGDRPYSLPSYWALDLAVGARRQVEDGITTERVFYFPSWRVRCDGRDVNAFPHPQTQLLSHRGTGTCEVRLGWTGWEVLGTALSLLALLLLGWLTLKGRRVSA